MITLTSNRQELIASNQTFESGQTYIDKSIQIDGNLTNTHNVTFENCRFRMTPNAKINMSQCRFLKCSLEGIETHSLYMPGFGDVAISNSTFDDFVILKEFNTINITGTESREIRNFWDFSTSVNFILANHKIVNFRIKGKCEHLDYYECYLTSSSDFASLWDKQVNHKLRCVRTVFDNCELNPFSLVTKCQEKDSVDLTGVKLNDDWSRLRKKYAGLSLFIIFLLTFIFFLPILTHSFFLLVLKKVDTEFVEIAKVPLWEALLFGGKEGGAAVLYSFLTIALLVYNILRLWITISVSKLREEENFLRDAQFHLISIHPKKIKVHLFIDKILSVLFWISVSYSIFKIIDTLFVMVPSF